MGADREQSLALLQLFMDTIPFNRMLGMKVEDLAPGFARVSLPFQESLIGDPRRPAIHGGVTASLIDACGGAAIFTYSEGLDAISTVDMRVDFLRPGKPETIIAEARVLRLGNRVGVTDVIAYQGDGRDEPIATGKAVYNIRRADER